MEPKLPWRVRVLAWGNLIIGIAAPVGVLFNIVAALEVFSLQWAKGSIILATIFGAALGGITGLSGWAILKGRPSAFRRTWIAAGLTLGYVVTGVFTMLTAGLDRTREILIRHGSDHWWDWSLGHFQNSVLRETPLLAWWILSLGTAIRYQLPGGPEKMRDRFTAGILPFTVCACAGFIARLIQMTEDTLLSSQR